MQIYLKKDMSQTVCIYFFFFVTGGCEKLIFGTGGMKKEGTMKKQIKLEAFKK